jgi:hypothetical protein
MYEGLTPTKFGRVQSPPPMQLHRLHIPTPASRLKQVMHTPALPVLDQEDLDTQGISTSALVPGAQEVTALGSCVYNSMTQHLAERWVAAGRDLAAISLKDTGCAKVSLSATDAKQDEEFAIVAYHAGTDQTGNPATEWPPTDCGSSGFDACQFLEQQGLATTYKTGAGVRGALSQLQSGTVMQGFPWFKSWMSTDKDGFVDGDGSVDAFMAALESGVAGGHETLQVGIPQLALPKSGHLELQNTIIECLNSWSTAFGISGRYRLHASTLDLLGSYADFKQIAV